MANEVDLSLEQTVNSKVDKKTTSTSSNTKKEGLSLFDSLLSSNSKKTLDSTVEDKANLLDKSTSTNLSEDSNIESLNKTSNSLLDKMLLDAKENLSKKQTSSTPSLVDNKDIDTESTSNKSSQISTNSSIDKINLESKENIKNKGIVSSDDNLLDNSNNKVKENLNKNQQMPNKFYSNTPSNTSYDSSLLDKILVDNKDNKQTLNTTKALLDNKVLEIKDTLNNQQQVSNITSLDKVTTQTKDNISNKEFVNLDNNLLQSPKINDNVNNINESKPQKLEIKASSLKTNDTLPKEEVKNIEKKTLNTPSLMDSLIDDAKINSKSLDNKKANTENIQTTSRKQVSLRDEIKNAEKINVKETYKQESLFDKESLVNSDKKVNIDLKSNEINNTIKKDLELKNLNLDDIIENKKIVIDSKEEIVNNTSTKNLSLNLKTSPDNIIINNIYLSQQKNTINNQMLSNKKEAVQLVKEAKSTSDVKTGADLLQLNVENTNVKVENPTNSNLNGGNQNNSSKHNPLLFDKLSSLSHEGNKEKSSNTSSKDDESTTFIKTEVNLNVSSSNTLTIQNRIIGAQQQMSSMMSDIAREMYENYKPPITAFKINLNPSHLGHIAILMKNDKDNSINISMNMSSSKTLDSLVENQNLLKDALAKNFNNDNNAFNLEFNMQSDNSQNQSSRNEEQNNKKFQNKKHSSTEIIEAVTQNKNTADDINYM